MSQPLQVDQFSGRLALQSALSLGLSQLPLLILAAVSSFGITWQFDLFLWQAEQIVGEAPMTEAWLTALSELDDARMQEYNAASGALVPGMFIALVFNSGCFLAYIFALTSSVAGIQVTVNQALSRAIGGLLSVFVLQIILSILVVLGLMTFVAPVLLVLAMFGLAYCDLAIDRKGPFSALRRSLQLTKNRWIILSSFWLLLAALYLAAVYILASLAQIFGLAPTDGSTSLEPFVAPSWWIIQILSLVVSVVVVGFGSGFVTHVYGQLRSLEAQGKLAPTS